MDAVESGHRRPGRLPALVGAALRDATGSGADAVGIALVGGVGIATLALHFAHVVSPGAPLRLTVAASVLAPIWLSLALLGLCSWWLSAGVDDDVLRAGVWCVVGTALLLGVGVESVLYQDAVGGRMADLLFVLTNHATIGAVIGLVMGIYDGRRHRSELSARADRERAERLNRRLTVLNRVLRHDLRNAVDIVRGNARIIRRESDAPARPARAIEEKATELHRISERASEIDDLIARGGEGPRPVDVASVVRERVAGLEADHPEAAVTVDAPPEARARAHPLIATAVAEIVRNAIEHADRESPSVAVDVSARGDGVEVAVSDDGPGIHPEERRVLDRGDETALEHLSGLGLWLADWIVEESDGSLEVRTPDAGGTTVTIRLPPAART